MSGRVDLRHYRAHVAIGLVPDLSVSARRVGHALVVCADASGRCAPGVDFLTEGLGMSRAGVFRALAQLCRAGLFWRLEHGGGAGRPTAFSANWPRLDAVAAEHTRALAGAGGADRRGGD